MVMPNGNDLNTSRVRVLVNLCFRVLCEGNVPKVIRPPCFGRPLPRALAVQLPFQRQGD